MGEHFAAIEGQATLNKKGKSEVQDNCTSQEKDNCHVLTQSSSSDLASILVHSKIIGETQS